MSTVIIPEIVAPQTFLAIADSFNLTVKQKLWADHFIETRNATKSAELAGYSGDYNTIKQVGTENLAKPSIREYLEARFGEMIIGSNEVLSELSAMARVNCDKESVVRPVDKLKALELAGKFYKHWDRQPDELPSDPDALASLLAQAFDRLRSQRSEQARLQAAPPDAPSQLE